MPGPLARAELTHIDRVPVDMARAYAQHDAYRAALAAAGAVVTVLPSLPDFPDCCFVEDTAVILPELVIRTRPGAVSRQGEVAAIAPHLPADRPHVTVAAPGTVDGGDVLVVGRDIFIGLTLRSNAAAVAQVAEAAAPFGYRVTGVPLAQALHLKTAVSALADDLVLVNTDWVDPAIFGRRHIASAPGEPFAANSLTIGTTVFHAAGPATLARIAAAGFDARYLDIGEFAKAEAGLTCLSLVFRPVGF
ncbi:dimethylargininase [Polymorphobacter fuscus]|uniref:Dimethylargininase n=1 Tax=Sandarakinorhabdus fusca TaxID=1439888 RepID=A0A7C9KY76_9SPHN|nr:dimethylargininase [Polymorphobacter fuscus]KAB7645510.1 dimethylargininase [Polymorphobacter fuscus]MQT17946.1 dimethylargininase [Polymorphobacter fuscus]NJC08576.1 dimethylargininase [Polymorphobacter fuscus]